ncbi:Transmembrane protein [Prescottella defluvii]
MRAVPSLYSLTLAGLILGPLLGPGYLLLRDAVSTPRSYVTDSALGLTDAAARAVPQDWLIAVLSSVVDGGVVVKAILFAALWLAGWGAARMVAVLLPGVGLGPQLVASTVTVWNPYVAERLLQGHWSLLTGYAALLWVVYAAVAIRRGRQGGWWALALCLAAAGLTPTGAILAAVVAAALLVRLPGDGGYRRGARAVCRLVALFLVTSAPWLVATVLSGGGGTSDPAGVAAFAARAEPGLGTIGSLAGLGGIWNSAAVPGSRTSLWALAGTLLLLTVVACGVPALWRRRRHPVIVALAVVAGFAVLLPALGATGWGLAVGEWAVVQVPGAGLLRDTQKWVALAAPLYALAAAAGVRALSSRVPLPGAVPVAAIAAVVLALPDLVWGVGGALKPVQYPASWQQVVRHLEAAEDAGDVAVLPAGMFRKFPYSGDAPVLDPAPRMLPADVLQTGQLLVGQASAVDGEGARATRVENLLLAGAGPQALVDENVRWVLVERTTPGPLGDSQRTLDQLEPVFADDDLALYRVPGSIPPDLREGRGEALAAHLLWAALLVTGGLGVLQAHRRGRHGFDAGDEPRHVPSRG